MARINSREELKEYALRALGAPVLLINVDDEQLEDRIDDVLDLFWEYHADGSELVFLHHQVTQEDKDTGKFILPPGVLSVLSVYHAGSNSGGGSNGIATINLQYQAHITDIMNPRRIMLGGLGAFYITQSYLNLISDTFSAADRLTFNKHHDRLTILSDWGQVNVGDWIGIEAYIPIVPDENGGGDVWNNRWLKRYTIAQFKLQWGSNLIKFAGAMLPGNIQINAEQIYSEAKEEIARLEEELKNDYQLPVDFFVG